MSMVSVEVQVFHPLCHFLDTFSGFQEHVLVVHEGLEEPLDLGQVEGTVKRTRHPG